MQKVDHAKMAVAPGGTTASTKRAPRPGVTVVTQPVNRDPTIYVVGNDGKLHAFATPTQFLHDGYNGACTHLRGGPPLEKNEPLPNTGTGVR